MGVVFFKESDSEVHLARILDLREFSGFRVVVGGRSVYKSKTGLSLGGVAFDRR